MYTYVYTYTYYKDLAHSIVEAVSPKSRCGQGWFLPVASEGESVHASLQLLLVACMPVSVSLLR